MQVGHKRSPAPFHAAGGPAPPTHLLMYSAFSCLPQVLHLKQPRCQCLSKATKDWPFLISAPQPPQPGRKNAAQTSSSRARGAGLRVPAALGRQAHATRAGTAAGQRGASSIEGRRYYTTADVTMWKTNPEAHSCMH